MNKKYLSAEIIRLVSMPDMLAYYGFELNRQGFMHCPFHSERTPSFRAYKGDKGFFCYGCGAGGNVINFVMKYFDLDFGQACEKINDDFALGLPIGCKPTLRQKRKMEHRMAEIEAEQAEHEALVSAYQDALTEFVAYDKATEAAKPQADEPPTQKYLDLIPKKEYASYKLDEAEGALRAYENK